MEDFTIEIDAAGSHGVAVVRVVGDLDIATVGRLRAVMLDVFAGGHRSVVVDLVGVPFLDAAAMGLLVACHKRCRDRGGRLVLVTPDRHIRKLLRITGLDRVLARHDDEESALQAVAAATGDAAADATVTALTATRRVARAEAPFPRQQRAGHRTAGDRTAGGARLSA